MITVDKRLKTIADFITKDATVLDVGADHGYLSIYLVEQGFAKNCIATDVNEAPLMSARKNIALHSLSERIKTKLTDGLEGVQLDDVTDIVIAGMGGILISEILAKRHPLDGKNLVLQPMTQAPFLRSWLCENGYEILTEAPSFANDKWYCIINAVYDGKKRECDEVFSLTGKMPESLYPEKSEYLIHIEEKLQKKISGLKKSQKESEELQKNLDLVDKLRSKM